ncbi:DNA polymerase III subunit delta' [Mycoplasmatota bacterium]|nr:DNA polymerase III subunit delta' [Mycoplasmatota bacterium]
MSLEACINIQPKVIKMLMNSYKKNRLSHAYLFEGEKGTKKKEIALEFAKLLYCEETGNVCDRCINCLRIEHNNHPNVLIIEPENNTIKKEQVLYLQQEYSKTNLEPGPKIYIIVNIDKMSNNAANSILKFIEEPQEETYTILITDNIHQILPTIISRCQVINFQPIPKKEIINYLIQHKIDPYIASICAHLTNDLEEALIIASDDNINHVIDLVKTIGQAILTKKENLIVIAENSQIDLSKNKKSLEYFLDILLMYMRDIKNVDNDNDNVIFIHELDFMKNHINRLTSDKIIYNINEILKSKISLEYNANTVLLIDHLLINLM